MTVSAKVLVKVCGLTQVEDVRAAAEAGADYIGINLWPSSKRSVSADRARELVGEARSVRAQLRVVGVCVNPSDGELTIAQSIGFDYLQLHGDESVERVASAGERAFKAVSIASADDARAALEYPGELLLVDTPTAGYGGSGESFDWRHCEPLWRGNRRWLLAGGLRPENVAAAIAVAKPSGVDVASGVESAPGIKDHAKMREFVRAAKGITR